MDTLSLDAAAEPGWRETLLEVAATVAKLDDQQRRDELLRHDCRV